MRRGRLVQGGVQLRGVFLEFGDGAREAGHRALMRRLAQAAGGTQRLRGLSLEAGQALVPCGEHVLQRDGRAAGRFGVAQALVSAPRLLLLDEPTSALDPMGRKDVLDMIVSLRGRTTVFFSTHILGDVERVCDSVAILDHGRVVAQAPIDELKRRYGKQKVVVEVTEGADALAA